MFPDPGELLHFSEDPTITRFEPHVAATARQPEAYVWAVDVENAASYWFPRQCPRAMAWAGDDTTDDDRRHILGAGGATRVHAVEYGWLGAIRTTQLYAYRFDADSFRPFGEPRPHAFVATEAVTPLGPAEPVGPLLHVHEQAGIELRVVAELWPFWNHVIVSTLEFSGIRLANARLRPTGHVPEPPDSTGSPSPSGFELADPVTAAGADRSRPVRRSSA